MLTMTVRSKDLAYLHELDRAALPGDMFYSKPYRANDQTIGAEGTLLAVSGGSLVGCIMATSSRTIIHVRIPCTTVDNNDGDLFSLEAPRELYRGLRRFGDKPLVLTFDGSRLEIILPRPKNMRGKIWLPMKCVSGRMLSCSCQDPGTTVSIKLDVLLAALRQIPHSSWWDPLAIQPSGAAVDLRYLINGITAHERLPADTVKQNGSPPLFVCSATRVAGLLRVLKCIPKGEQDVHLQISASRMAIWNDRITVQFFADRNPVDWKRLSISENDSVTPEIKLHLDRRAADLPTDVGKWLRRLVRNALAHDPRFRTTWLLSRHLVTVFIDCGLQMTIEIPCTCDSWSPDEDRVCLRAEPPLTAAMLEQVEKDKHGCRLAYRDGRLSIQSDSRPCQLTASVTPVSDQRLEEDIIAGARPR